MLAKRYSNLLAAAPAVMLLLLACGGQNSRDASSPSPSPAGAGQPKNTPLRPLTSGPSGPSVPDQGLSPTEPPPTGSSPTGPVEPTPIPEPSGVVPEEPGSGELEPSGPLTIIRVRYPFLGRRVELRGSEPPLSWDRSTPMEYVGDETFEFRTRAFAAGRTVQIKPLLMLNDDGSSFKWSRGANFSVRAGSERTVFPCFYDEQGRVESLIPEFKPARLLPRPINVYYPMSYFENTLANYPVLYMHDGQNLFDNDSAFGGQSWLVRDALDDAAWTGLSQEVVVIAVGNTRDRIGEYTPSANPRYQGSGRGDEYLSMVRDELQPVVRRLVRVRSQASETGIMGSSLGGLISMWAGLKAGDNFGLIGALSPSTWWDNRFILGAVPSSLATTRAARFYIDSGDSGNSNDDVANTTALATAVRSLGYQDGSTLLHVVQQGAAHNEYYWAQRFPNAVAFLFGPR